MKRNNIISEIEERDLIQLQQILKDVFNNDISYEKMKDFYKISKQKGDVYTLGYYLDDNLVGTVILNIMTIPSGREATIWDLAIKEEYRKLGIATKLMNEAEEIVKSYDNIKDIWLFSGYHREDEHKLYEKLGYDGNLDRGFRKRIN